MREYFCAYHSMLGAMRKLSDAECGRLFRALLAYSSGEQLDNLQGREELLFDVFAQQIDRDAEKYKEKCAVNRTNGGKRTVANGSERLRTVTNGSVGTQEKEKEKEEYYTRAALIDDDEALLLAQGHQSVLDEAERWGFPRNTGTYDALTALIAQHGVDRMLDALKSCGQQGVPKLPYLRKVLESEPRKAAGSAMNRLF